MRLADQSAGRGGRVVEGPGEPVGGVREDRAVRLRAVTHGDDVREVLSNQGFDSLGPQVVRGQALFLKHLHGQGVDRAGLQSSGRHVIACAAVVL